MSEVTIKTQRLTRDFKSVRAVNELSMEVTSVTVFGFLGPNGSGKTTTTIHLLLGLLEPSSLYRIQALQSVFGVSVAHTLSRMSITRDHSRDFIENIIEV
jgi:ABC-type multidrug transport system ATPase subunit